MLLLNRLFMFLKLIGKSKLNIWKPIKCIADIFLWLWLFIYTVFSLHAFAFSENVEDKVYVIDKTWQYLVLNPLGGDSLGFTPPFIGVAFVNKEAVDDAKTSLEGIIKHESKHIEQFWALGFKHFQTDEWKLEGVADYVRGEPTANLCEPIIDETKTRLKYRDFFILAKYLIESQGLSENQIYSFDEYPLDAATEWVLATECNQAKQID